MTKVYENDHYAVIIGRNEFGEQRGNNTVYKIINKEYGVVELETTVLPKALFEADDLSDMTIQHAIPQPTVEPSGNLRIPEEEVPF